MGSRASLPPSRNAGAARTVELVTFVEGPSDVAFFPEVLRMLLDAVLEDGPVSSTVTVELLNNAETRRGDWVVDRIRHRYVDATVVVVHVDGSADTARELRTSFTPIEDVWQQDGLAAQLVPLVPVREMEAWALADLSIVRDVAGAGWDAAAVTQGHLLNHPERLSDPQRTLADVMSQARRPRRSKRRVDTFLPLIAERIGLPALRRLPSFQQFEADLRAALLPASETTP